MNNIFIPQEWTPAANSGLPCSGWAFNFFQMSENLIFVVIVKPCYSLEYSPYVKKLHQYLLYKAFDETLYWRLLKYNMKIYLKFSLTFQSNRSLINTRSVFLLFRYTKFISDLYQKSGHQQQFSDFPFLKFVHSSGIYLSSNRPLSATTRIFTC